jgi:hypothetical protein
VTGTRAVAGVEIAFGIWILIERYVAAGSNLAREFAGPASPGAGRVAANTIDAVTRGALTAIRAGHAIVELWGASTGRADPTRLAGGVDAASTAARQATAGAVAEEIATTVLRIRACGAGAAGANVTRQVARNTGAKRTAVVAAHAVDTMAVCAFAVVRATGALRLLRGAGTIRAVGSLAAVAARGGAGGADRARGDRTGAVRHAGACPITGKQSATALGIGVDGVVGAGANMSGNVAGLAGSGASAAATDAVHAMARVALRVVLASGAGIFLVHASGPIAVLRIAAAIDVWRAIR